jgi:4-hydroxy-3-methylbut-2-enyl diphosphate reductase
MTLRVEIDDNSGFCFGVVYAVEMAEELLNEYGKLYCLGDIVHNEEEVKRLQSKGLVTINHSDLENLRNEKVLIRAHGESPDTYKIAMKNQIELIDASCPVVLKLQHRIRESYHNSENPVYIYGKHGHPEVIGLLGQTNGNAIVFQSLDELKEKEPFPSQLTLFSQTTKDMRNYYEILDYLKSKDVTVNFNDTLCRQVSNRDIELREFSKKYDTIIFVSGTKSSNGKVLYGVCKDNNPNTYFISSTSELKPEWFKSSTSVGICGATSTPQWLMEEVKSQIEKF